MGNDNNILFAVDINTEHDKVMTLLNTSVLPKNVYLKKATLSMK